MTVTEYYIPATPVKYEEIIKKSRFIVSISHAETPENAKAFIKSVRDAYSHANHNCFAYMTCPPGHVNGTGMSDDGEPSGTAGKPMLGVLLNSNVGEIAAVVTRYFGGVKLGTGGLVRAYSGVLKNGLNLLETTLKIIRIPVFISVSYADIQTVKHLIDQFGAESENETFSETVEMLVLVRQGDETSFSNALQNMTKGRAVVNFLNQKINK